MSLRPEMCPQPLQSLHHGATFEPLCAPILFSQPRIGDNLWLVCNGFSARHKYCWCTSHSCNVMKWVRNCWNWRMMTFMHRDMRRTSWVNLPFFSVMTGWIVEVLFLLFYPYTTVKWTEHGCVWNVLAYWSSKN